MSHITEVKQSTTEGWYTASCDCGWSASSNNQQNCMDMARWHRTVSTKEPTQSADLNADYNSLAKENRRLTELNSDLHQQNTELRASKLLSPAESESIAQLRRDFDRVNVEVNKLAKWMSDNKAKEIRQGKHMGMTLSEICIMYMAKGLVD